jgi:hypothetical protein
LPTPCGKLPATRLGRSGEPHSAVPPLLPANVAFGISGYPRRLPGPKGLWKIGTARSPSHASLRWRERRAAPRRHIGSRPSRRHARQECSRASPRLGVGWHHSALSAPPASDRRGGFQPLKRTDGLAGTSSSLHYYYVLIAIAVPLPPTVLRHTALVVRFRTLPLLANRLSSPQTSVPSFVSESRDGLTRDAQGGAPRGASDGRSAVRVGDGGLGFLG